MVLDSLQLMKTNTPPNSSCYRLREEKPVAKQKEMQKRNERHSVGQFA